MTISQQIKDAIRRSEKTVYQIAKETGVTQAALSRFMSTDPNQHRDIRLEATADKLAAYFGLALGPEPPAGRPAKRKGKRK